MRGKETETKPQNITKPQNVMEESEKEISMDATNTLKQV